MAAIIINGITHSRAFVKHFLLESRITEWEGVERYSAYFEVSGSKVKIVCDYSTNEVILWFEAGALKFILLELLRLDDYLSKALITGSIPLELEMVDDGFLELPGARFAIAKVAHGLWIGSGNRDFVFSATIEGLAELLDLLEGGV